MMPGQGNHLLTAHAAYLVGGIDPQDRGDPLVIKTVEFCDLTASVQKAVCIHAMYKRGLVAESPMLASIDLLYCCKGFRTVLKLVAGVQDRIRSTLNVREFGRDGQQRWAQPIPTWNELIQDITSYG